MVEHSIRKSRSFIPGNLVYTGTRRILADCLENGLPKKDLKRVFGNPNSDDTVIRVGMLTKRTCFADRIKYGSCLIPKFSIQDGDDTFGIAIDTSQLIHDPRYTVRAVGLGFKEDALESLFGIQLGISQYQIPIDRSEELVGLIDEVHILLEKERRIDPQYIRGVVVKGIQVGLFPLIDRFTHIPFFDQQGRLLK